MKEKKENIEKKNLCIEALDFLIEVLVKEEEASIFQESYYKNKFLDYAIKEHLSPQCVIRTYAEMLKASSRLTGDNTDLMHSNALLNYLRICDDEKDLEYINDLIYFLRNECCEKCKDEFPHLVLEPKGRIKSFKSYEANERNKLLRFKLFRRLNKSSIDEIQALFDEKKAEILKLLETNCPSDFEKKSKAFFEGTIFSDDTENSVKKYTQELLEQTVKKNSYSDLVGYRLIVYSVNRSTEECELINYLYPLEEKIKDFFLNEGFVCLSRKDFVSNKKENGYQSIHIVFEILQIFVEIQIRTVEMDNVAENGSAAHSSAYKAKNPMYLFVEELLYNISDKYKKTNVNELLGLLKSLDASNRPWNATPKEEIPYTPKELKEFHDLEFIKKCLDL